MDKIGSVVTSPSSPSFSTAHVTLDLGCTVRPGEILLVEIEDGKHYAIARVEQGQEINPYESPDVSHMRSLLGLESTSQREDLPRRYRVIVTDIIEETIKKNGVFMLREPQTLIPAGSTVLRASTEVAALALGLSSGPSDDALNAGTLVGEAKIPVVLRARDVLPRHILIVGSTGTGKSYLRGVLAEEINSLGVPQVNIDVHGESIQATNELNGVNLIPGKTLTVPLSSLSEPEVISLIPYLTDLQGEIVRRAFLELKKKVKGTSMTFGVDHLLSEIARVGPLMEARPQTINIATARAEMLRYVSVIGSGLDWADLLNKKAFVNIDCRGLGHSELHAVAGAVARELLGLRMMKHIPPLVLSIDEAHMFIPYGEDTPAGLVIREAIRFGRHYGLCLILVTPNPTDIERRIIRITNTRFIFATEPDQLDALRGIFSDTPPDIIARLPKLEQGTCLLTGSRETIRHAVLLRVRSRKTTHGGETPDIITEARNFKAAPVQSAPLSLTDTVAPKGGEKKLDEWGK